MVSAVLTRSETVVEVDAATVYAEGMLSGLRTACNIIGRHDVGKLSKSQRDTLMEVFGHTQFGVVPPELHAQVTAWRAIVYHNQWLFQRGNAADCYVMPDRSQVMARIHAFIQMFPEISDGD